MASYVYHRWSQRVVRIPGGSEGTMLAAAGDFMFIAGSWDAGSQLYPLTVEP